MKLSKDHTKILIGGLALAMPLAFWGQWQLVAGLGAILAYMLYQTKDKGE